jgi:hypothetical protein
MERYMSMKEEKWKLVGGRVYRLAGVFDELADAVAMARKMKEHHHVFLARSASKTWSVYWRARIPNPECSPGFLST